MQSDHDKQIENLRVSEYNVLKQLAHNARQRAEIAASDELLALQLRGIQGALEGVELGKGAQAALAIRLAEEAAKARAEKAKEGKGQPAAGDPAPPAAEDSSSGNVDAAEPPPPSDVAAAQAD